MLQWKRHISNGRDKMMKRKIVALLLILAMILTFMPTMAFAEDTADAEAEGELISEAGEAGSEDPEALLPEDQIEVTETNKTDDNSGSVQNQQADPEEEDVNQEPASESDTDDGDGEPELSGDGILGLSASELSIEMLDYNIEASAFTFDKKTVIIQDDDDWGDIVSAEISNENVITLTNNHDSVEVTGKAVGTAVVTLTAANGDIGSFAVTVKAYPIQVYNYDYVNGTKTPATGAYIDSYDPDSDTLYYFIDGPVIGARSEDNSVLTLDIYDDDFENGALKIFEIIPQGAGSTNVVLEDYFGNDYYFPVEFTDNGIMEAKYKEYFSYNIDEYIIVEEGDESIEFELPVDEVSRITDEQLRDFTVSVKCGDIDLSGIKGRRTTSRTGDIYYVFNISLGRAVRWKEILEITITTADGYNYRVNSTAFREIDESEITTTVKNVTYNGDYQTPEVTVKYKGETLKKNKDYYIFYSDNKKVGTAYVFIESTRDSAYQFLKDIEFRILPKGTGITKLTGHKDGFTVTWNKQTQMMSTSRITGYQIQYSLSSSFNNPSSVKVEGYGESSKTISKLKSNNTYYVRIRTYMKWGEGTYCSEWSSPSSIHIVDYTPAATKITSIKARKRGFTVRYAKSGQATGYQIRYSIRSNMAGAKTVGTTSLTRTVTRLKGRRYYYVQVRAYRTVKVNGKSVTYYTDWSAKRRVRTR